MEPLGAGARALPGFAPPRVLEASSADGRAQTGERGGGFVQFLVGDVGVATDRREVCVAEVGGDEAGVAGLLAEPGRGGVAEGVGGDALLDRRPLGCTADNRGEDRRLQSLALEAAEDRRVCGRLPLRADDGKLVGERWCERLPARLAAFATTDEQ